MWTAALRQRFSLATVFGAVIGLGLALHPGASANADTTCGRVFLTNDQNELLSLRSPSQMLRNRGEADTGPVPFVPLRRARLPIGGLADAESLIGIDFRPSNGVLYGVGRIGADAMGQLYTIDVTSGLATPVGMRTIPLNLSPPAPSSVAFGVDFNPVPDRLRIVSDTGLNIRVNPDNGIVAGTDMPLAYPAVGDPNSTRTARVVAVAYTNSDNDPQTNTVLHDIDANRATDTDFPGSDVTAIQVPPNNGALNTVARLGVDTDDFAAFDIGPNNDALAALRPVGSAFSRLYLIDLPSGSAHDLGQIGQGELIVGLSIQVGPVCN